MNIQKKSTDMINKRLIVLGVMLTSLNAPSSLLAQEAPDGQPDSTPIIYKDVSLIDGIGDDIRQNMSIVVLGENITAVLSTNELTNDQTDGADIIDGSQWYALPGLVESHTHVATEPNRQFAEFILNRQLYSGITIARDLAGDARALTDLSRASLVKEIPAPDLKFVALMGGPEFFSDPRTISSGRGETPGNVSWMQAVTEKNDMQTAVAYARGTWATAIKTYAEIDGATMKLIADEARKQDILVWSHVHVGPALPMEVAKAGVRSMSHVDDLCAAAIPDDILAKAARGEISGYVDVDVNSPKIDAVFEEMKKHDTVLDPTLIVIQQGEGNVLMNIMRTLENVFYYVKERLSRDKNADPNRGEVRGRCSVKDAYDLTLRAYKSGVRISTGTDVFSEPDSLYPALFDEFRLLNEEVGIPMMDVIKASAVNGAFSVGMEHEAGTITVGKLANMVFLKDNPLDGVDSFETVVLTVKRGTPYYRKDFILGSPGEESR